MKDSKVFKHKLKPNIGLLHAEPAIASASCSTSFYSYNKFQNLYSSFELLSENLFSPALNLKKYYEEQVRSCPTAC